MTFSVAQVSFKHTYLYSKMINGSSFSSDVNCEKVMKVVILLKNAEDQTIIWESFHIWNLKVETQKSLFFFGGGLYFSSWKFAFVLRSFSEPLTEVMGQPNPDTSCSDK